MYVIMKRTLPPYIIPSTQKPDMPFHDKENINKYHKTGLKIVDGVVTSAK